MVSRQLASNQIALTSQRLQLERINYLLLAIVIMYSLHQTLWQQSPAYDTPSCNYLLTSSSSLWPRYIATCSMQYCSATDQPGNYWFVLCPTTVQAGQAFYNVAYRSLWRFPGRSRQSCFWWVLPLQQLQHWGFQPSGIQQIQLSLYLHLPADAHLLFKSNAMQATTWQTVDSTCSPVHTLDRAQLQ